MQKKLSLIIILLSSIYFISQFSRASLGVVIIDINGIANQEPILPKIDTIFSKDLLIFKRILNIIYLI